nr:MAG TPA: Periplasmic lysozyme inhibitor of I-type lysozyme [Caudoviricetes sp.]
MKRLRLIITLLLLLSVVSISEDSIVFGDYEFHESEPLSPLIEAISLVESNGIDSLIGDNGRAYGRLQIHQCVLDDVNRVQGTSFTLNDCFHFPTAVKIFYHYQDIYNPSFDTIKAIRIWNGGPKGHLKSSTKPYLNKVLTQLSKL